MAIEFVDADAHVVEGQALIGECMRLWPRAFGFSARNELLTEGRRYAQGCAALSGPLLPDSGTGYAALDMERLRVALGAPRISYFGMSYGSILGNVYADLFPNRVRAAVLDGAIDPHAYRDDPLALFGGALTSTQHAMDHFLAWCAAAPDCAFGDGHGQTTYRF